MCVFAARCRNLKDYMVLAEKIKKMFHEEGIHSTTIQPEFVEFEDEGASASLDSAEDCILDCPSKDKDGCVANTCCGPSKQVFNKHGENYSIGTPRQVQSAVGSLMDVGGGGDRRYNTNSGSNNKKSGRPFLRGLLRGFQFRQSLSLPDVTKSCSSGGGGVPNGTVYTIDNTAEFAPLPLTSSDINCYQENSLLTPSNQLSKNSKKSNSHKNKSSESGQLGQSSDTISIDRLDCSPYGGRRLDNHTSVASLQNPLPSSSDHAVIVVEDADKTKMLSCERF